MKRWNIGTQTLLQILLLALLLLSVNYLAFRNFRSVDLSRSQGYTLSNATRNYLQSPAVRDRADPIRWVIAYRVNSPFRERLEKLAEQYRQASGGKIEVEIFDPIRSPELSQQIAASYGIFDQGREERRILSQDVVILDARTKVEREAVFANPTAKINPAHVRIVTASQMVVYSSEANQQRRPVAFQGEDVLTASLVSAIEGRMRHMLFLADKSRINADGAQSSWQSLRTLMNFQNLSLEPVDFGANPVIPEGIEGVAIVAPKYDFSEAEIAVLKDYWLRPKSSLFILLEPGQVPDRLRKFLRENGITPQRDRVITKRGAQIVTDVRAVFLPGFEFTRDLAAKPTVLEGATCSLEVRESGEDLSNRKLTPFPLLQADQGYWGETKFAQGSPQFQPQEDHAEPLILAAGVIRGSETQDKQAASSSRMFVMGNTDFLEPEHRWQENFDFLASSLNWLVGREELAGIGPRSLDTFKLPLLDQQVNFINRLNLFFIPALLVMMSLLVWANRRA